MIKKQLIMDKALELFAKQGFEATSIQLITEHCGISKGAFYLSFKSKSELILALVDHFMMHITSDFDYLVNNVKDDDELLFKFYYTSFDFFKKHHDFARFFITEQTQTVNEELISKIHEYNRLNDKIILLMLERCFGEAVKNTKYDLVYCIKGFINAYSHLILICNIELDLDVLARSLVEKTNLLAKNTTIPFLTKEHFEENEQQLHAEVTKEQMLEILDQLILEIEEVTENESLKLIKQQLIEPTLSPVIVKGLLENIRNHPHCKLISYVLRKHYKF